MTVNVLATILIDRPIAEVADFAGDPSNAPKWYRRIESAEWQTEPPMMLGSQIRFNAKFMGRELVYTYEVTELTPGEQVAMQTSAGPFPMATTYTWRPVGDQHTHMALRNQGEPKGLSKLIAPFVARAMNQDLSDLKQLLEANKPSSRTF